MNLKTAHYQRRDLWSNPPVIWYVSESQGFAMRVSSQQRLSIAICLLGLLVLSVPPVHSQSPWGRLRGVVRDGSGARIAFAAVVMHRIGSGGERRARTDSRGEFQVSELNPGQYEVSVSSPGFGDAQSNVTVVVSVTREIIVVLQPVVPHQTVTVRGAGSSITLQPLNTSSAMLEGVATSQDLENFPLAHRSFANIAYLAPGTEPVEPSDPTKARITAVSFGGSSGLNVELSVDGGDNNDDYIGGFLQNYSPDAMQEFVVRTAQFEADTSRTNGGSVILSTRRGADAWHGDAAGFFRGSALNARNVLDNPEPNPKQPFSRQNVVFDIGGPLVRQKLWIFGDLEFVHEDASI